MIEFPNRSSDQNSLVPNVPICSVTRKARVQIFWKEERLLATGVYTREIRWLAPLAAPWGVSHLLGFMRWELSMFNILDHIEWKNSLSTVIIEFPHGLWPVQKVFCITRYVLEVWRFDEQSWIKLSSPLMRFACYSPEPCVLRSKKEKYKTFADKLRKHSRVHVFRPLILCSMCSPAKQLFSCTASKITPRSQPENKGFLTFLFQVSPNQFTARRLVRKYSLPQYRWFSIKGLSMIALLICQIVLKTILT